MRGFSLFFQPSSVVDITPSLHPSLFSRSHEPARHHSSRPPRECAVQPGATRLPERFPRRTLFLHHRARQRGHLGARDQAARSADDLVRLSNRHRREAGQSRLQRSVEARLRPDPPRPREVPDRPAGLGAESPRRRQHLRRRRAARQCEGVLGFPPRRIRSEAGTDALQRALPRRLELREVLPVRQRRGREADRPRRQMRRSPHRLRRGL